MSESPTVISSRYNFFLPSDEGSLLYNSKSGAVLMLQGQDASRLAREIGETICEIDPDCLPAALSEQLFQGGFLISPERDEVSEIREVYRRARRETPMVITITTTQDCNLGCYYCYEERSTAHLTDADLPAILELTEKNLKKSGKRHLHVDWYGGEPMLNVEFIETASPALQQLCSRLKVSYRASIISNGTCWTKDVGAFVRRHRIGQVQISFDGMKKNHDRRRRYRKDYKPEESVSSFEQAVNLVDKLLDHTRVDLRFNIDKRNRSDVKKFLDFAKARGWFDRSYLAVVQPARLSAYSEHSSFMRRNELTLEEFDAIRAMIRKEAGADITVEESEAPDGFPYPKTSVCAALSEDSVVIGADGMQYRCGLQVGETARAVGKLVRKNRRELPVLHQTAATDAEWWKDFDPTTLPKCSRCSFLPICWGGCPKKHLENDAHAIAEQSAFWRKNLARLITKGIGIKIQNDFAFEERHQFR